MNRQITYDDMRVILKNGGKFSVSDIGRIKDSLYGRNQHTDVSILLRCLAYSSPATTENVLIVETILKEKEQDWWMQGALYALCREWKLTEAYLQELFDLTQAQRWELFSDSATTAFSLLGSFLEEKQDSAVYAHLLRVIKYDEELFGILSPDFWPVHLEAAVNALDRGVRKVEALTRPYKISAPGDIPISLLQEATKRARAH